MRRDAAHIRAEGLCGIALGAESQLSITKPGFGPHPVVVERHLVGLCQVCFRGAGARAAQPVTGKQNQTSGKYRASQKSKSLEYSGKNLENQNFTKNLLNLYK